LTQKYGEAVKSSSEYNLLKDSMKVHYKNCDNFIKQLEKSLEKEQKFDVFFDDFEKYSHFEEFAEAKRNNYDLIFSLGGDGTFLRSLNFNNSNDQLVIGLNTDGMNSRGFYCNLNSMDEKIEEKIQLVFQNKFNHKFLNKLKVQIISENADYFINSNLQNNNNKNKENDNNNNENNEIREFDSLYMDDKRNVVSNKVRSYSFINDLYYGEKFMGRISKCDLELENDNKSHTFKSSGLIVSTCNFFFLAISLLIKNIEFLFIPKLIDLGYSGWIKNANTISFSKFENLIKYTSNNTLSDSKILGLYNNRVFIIIAGNVNFIVIKPQYFRIA
jgi:NAD kinase